MIVEAGENIRIRDYTEQMSAELERLLTFDNPEYYKRLNMGKWVGKTPQKITLIQRDGTDLIVPFGMLPWIFRHRNEFEAVRGDFKALSGFEYHSTIKPYAYQEKAIQAALKARQGVVVAPCGSGKTQIGLEIAARLGGKTLWLTHTHDLLTQSMERAKSLFGLQGKDYGTITGGKIDIGRVITFATVQTMVNIDLAAIKDCFDVVIVDECHHAVGTPTRIMMFSKVVSSLKARYKYGLTATPKRADGLIRCMFALIGEKVYEVEASDVSERVCPVTVEFKKTEYKPDLDKILMPDGTLSHVAFINELVKNEDRNKLIVDDVCAFNGTCLVLTDRVAHIQMLKRMLEDRGVGVCALSAATGKQAKRDREGAIRALNNREVKVLIATYALAREGLDIPSLNLLVMATPQKNDVTVTQSAGRVARKAEDKACGVVYDYIDDFAMLGAWQKKRLRIYKRLGFSIVE